jgi:hypothetical protein
MNPPKARFQFSLKLLLLLLLLTGPLAGLAGIQVKKYQERQAMLRKFKGTIKPWSPTGRTAVHGFQDPPPPETIDGATYLRLLERRQQNAKDDAPDENAE